MRHIILAVVMLAVALVCVGCPVRHPGDDDGDDADAMGDAGAAPDAPPSGRRLTPVAPTASRFMWQGLQTEFLYSDGSTCSGRVTVAISDQAACYTASDDRLRCAGRVYVRSFGSTFEPIELSGVDQVFLSPTVNTETGNSICVHMTSGRVDCMGQNANGVFGNTTTNPVDIFNLWGMATDVVAIGTGTWDQLCGLDSLGRIWCSGIGFGTTPALQPGSGYTSFWVRDTGTMEGDDPTVFRAAPARTECQVTSLGLSCPGDVNGPAGEVVDGNSIGPGPEGRRCWLTSAGEVHCSAVDMMTGTMTAWQLFAAAGNVLALATSPHTTSMCAVVEDASLWCIGPNERGKLGTGDEVALALETRVQPPGSVYVGCP